MEEALLARLRAATAIQDATATVNGRAAVDWAERKSENLPYLVLYDISDGLSYTHNGAVDLTNPLIQFDCWGRTYGEAKILSRAVREVLEQPGAFNDVAFDASFVSSGRSDEPEDLDGGIKVYRYRLDMTVWSHPVS